MKKTLIAVAMVLGTFATAQAQYSPSKGDFSTEISFTPFKSDGAMFSLSDGAVQGRYFLTDKDALRVMVGFGYNNKNNTTEPENAGKTETNNSNTAISFGAGYERHFKQIDRFDLYAGVGAAYGLTSNTNKEEYSEKGNSGSTETTKKGNIISAGVFAGFDFYVTKNIYVGTELSLGYGYTSYPAKETTTTVNGKSVTVTSDDSSSNTNIGFDIEPAVRLGFRF